MQRKFLDEEAWIQDDEPKSEAITFSEKESKCEINFYDNLFIGVTAQINFRILMVNLILHYKPEPNSLFHTDTMKYSLLEFVWSISYFEW